MAKTELMEKAKQFYLQGKSLAEIAEILIVSPGTVRSWKSRGKWDSGDATQRNVAEKRCNAKPVEKQLIQSVESNDELTDAQKAFCLYYSKTFNATMAYKRAFGCDYASANTAGPRLLVNVRIRAEITRLKEIRSAGILATADDVVDRYMKIAFSDISDFLEFGRATVPVMGPFGPIQVKVPGSKEKITLTKEINDVRLKESSEVDGTLISEVKQGKDGTSVKLADRMKALDWLSNYFELNPMDRHRVEFENKKLQLEQQKIKDESHPQETEDDPITKSLKEEFSK